MSQPSFVEIIVPCYNPIEGWQNVVINSYQQFQQAIGLPCHLIMVNDGSTQGIEDSHINFLQKNIPDFYYHSYSQNKGKGYALRYGIEKTKGNTIILTDIDFPYTNESMLSIYKLLINGNQLALGHREDSYYKKVPFARQLISKSFRVILRSFFSMNVNDTQCGLKGLGKDGKAVFLKTQVDGYLFDLELVRLSQKAKLKIGRANVYLKDGIAFTNMRFSILFKEAKNFIGILWRS